MTLMRLTIREDIWHVFNIQLIIPFGNDEYTDKSFLILSPSGVVLF